MFILFMLKNTLTTVSSTLVLRHFYDKTIPFYFALVHGYQCFDSKVLIENTLYFLSTIILFNNLSTFKPI